MGNGFRGAGFRPYKQFKTDGSGLNIAFGETRSHFD